MMYDLVIDRSMVGQTIGPPGGGFLIDLIQTESASNEPAQASPDGVWKSVYLQLRGSLDHRDIYCAIPSQNFMNWTGKRKILIADHSLDYRGDLMVRCVPKDAVFEISLSDVELTAKERLERAKARQRKELEGKVAALLRKADKLAPAEPAAPPMIEGPDERERVPVMAEVDKPKTPARRR
jgi:hypothetical protein